MALQPNTHIRLPWQCSICMLVQVHQHVHKSSNSQTINFHQAYIIILTKHFNNFTIRLGGGRGTLRSEAFDFLFAFSRDGWRSAFFHFLSLSLLFSTRVDFFSWMASLASLKAHDPCLHACKILPTSFIHPSGVCPKMGYLVVLQRLLPSLLCSLRGYVSR